MTNLPLPLTLLQTIKADGFAWASKYARGGSARKLSARKFYIVVDALQGHITSNGELQINHLIACLVIMMSPT